MNHGKEEETIPDLMKSKRTGVYFMKIEHLKNFSRNETNNPKKIREEEK